MSTPIFTLLSRPAFPASSLTSRQFGPTPTPADHALSQLVSSAFEAQSPIVWSNSLCGRLASELFLARDCRCAQSGRSSQARIPTLGPHLVGSLWDCLSLSYLIATIISTDTACKALQLAKLNARFTYAYSVQDEVDASDFRIFHKPLASRLLDPLSCNLSWTSLFERIRAVAVAPSADTDAPILADFITPILPSVH